MINNFQDSKKSLTPNKNTYLNFKPYPNFKPYSKFKLCNFLLTISVTMDLLKEK